MDTRNVLLNIYKFDNSLECWHENQTLYHLKFPGSSSYKRPMFSRPLHPRCLLQNLAQLSPGRWSVPNLQRHVHEQPRSQNLANNSDLYNVAQEQHFPFASAKLGTFTQEAPRLGNQFLEDALLQSYLKRHLPEQVKESLDREVICDGA